ncbi:hypothetical protein B0A48_08390 [Cryoendolithus antarcticus]|uniref:1,4-alpha-D-glucan glucohydrolase n=1 Tax=Cryoendolithus antarcticus TaxID=1507870 RepID=A0A1V8T5A9_9PEZI|nr:hypothetical protein B0A48_08390 [Cryoendolithus antarcticus]
MLYKAAVPFVAIIFAGRTVHGQLEARATSTLTSWLASERPVARKGILNNLGSNGSKAQGVGDGILVASPSTTDPPYFYTCTRDSALTFKILVDNFLTYKTAGLETKIQQATALIAYAQYLISQGSTSVATSIISPIVQNDLSYATQYWNQTGFDLWEEVNSASFFTTGVQLLRCDSMTYQPCSDKALSNQKIVTDSFRSIYAINSGIHQDVGIAVERHPEYVYQGGNPCTFAAAEQLYDAVYQWKRIGSLSITSTSLDFFKNIYPSAAIGTYASSTVIFTLIVDAVSACADSYMFNAQKYAPQNGAIAEQAYAARANNMSASWGASSACSATPTLTTVTFNEFKITTPGDTIYITGSISQLGNWNTSAAVALSAAQYTSSNPKWFTSVSLAAGGVVSYKYSVKSGDGPIIWESDPDRTLTVAENCAGMATQNDNWR